MSELNCRLWLNWEAFELASVNSLFTADISLLKIGQFAAFFEDVTQTVSFEQWKENITKIFRLNENQISALYSTLVCFLTHEPQEALQQCQLCLANPVALPSMSLRCTDLLCFLFVIFVKKKYHSVSEVTNLEQFPGKCGEVDAPRLSTKAWSKSSPAVGRKSLPSPTPKQSDTSLQIMQRFLINNLPKFVQIYAPNGFSRYHIESLSFLIVAGPNYYTRYTSLSVAFDLFHDGCQYEKTKKVQHILNTLLLPKEIENAIPRIEATNTSPLAYRPFYPRGVPQHAELAPFQVLDQPILIEDLQSTFKLEQPNFAADVHIHSIRHSTIYLLSAMSAVFVSHARDSTIFVGSAVAIHLENCINVRLIAASRMVHLEGCTRCTSFLLTNTRPLVTGSCSRLVFAPYNAIYTKLCIDLLTIGINPQLNFWNSPIILGSLVSSVFEKMSPQAFTLFAVPFSWGSANPMINQVIPPNYLSALELRRNAIMTMKTDLDRIRSKDQALYEKIVDNIKKLSSKYVQDEGYMQEVNWLYTDASNAE